MLIQRKRQKTAFVKVAVCQNRNLFYVKTQILGIIIETY